MLKQISFELRGEIDDLCLVLATELNGKALLSVIISNNLVKRGLNANNIIKEIAKEIKAAEVDKIFCYSRR